MAHPRLSRSYSLSSIAVPSSAGTTADSAPRGVTCHEGELELEEAAQIGRYNMIDWSWKTIQPCANLIRDLTVIAKRPGTNSIYCCVLGDAAVCGLQGQFEGRYGIAVRDFGELHDAPVFRTRVDW